MMKGAMSVLAAIWPLLLAPTVAADEAHHPEKDKKPVAAAPAAADRNMQMPMGTMQDSMLRMHEQMHRIMQAKDPKERDRLKQEHMQMMQEHMKSMHGMTGDGMMGPGMMGGDGKGGMAGAPAGK